MYSVYFLNDFFKDILDEATLIISSVLFLSVLGQKPSYLTLYVKCRTVYSHEWLSSIIFILNIYYYCERKF